MYTVIVLPEEMPDFFLEENGYFVESRQSLRLSGIRVESIPLYISHWNIPVVELRWTQVM